MSLYQSALEKLAENSAERSPGELGYPYKMADELLYNDHLSHRVLDKLADHSNIDILRRVARHRKVSQEILHHLSDHPSSIVRRAAAEKTRWPGTQRKLAQDEVDDVRVGLAENPTLEKETFQKLSKDMDSLVRLKTVTNFFCPRSVRDDVAENDKSQMVRNRAVQPF